MRSKQSKLDNSVGFLWEAPTKKAKIEHLLTKNITLPFVFKQINQRQKKFEQLVGNKLQIFD